MPVPHSARSAHRSLCSRTLTVSTLGLLFGLAASLTLGACKKKKETCKPGDYEYKDIQVYIQAAADLNIDEDGNPLPTVVRIFQLNGDLATRSLDLNELWEDHESALGDEYISDKEIEVFPDSQELIPITPEGEARFILAVGGFQQPVGNTWYRVYEVPDTYGQQACELVDEDKDPGALGEPCVYLYMERNQIDGGKNVPPGFDEDKLETTCTPIYTPKAKTVEADDKDDKKDE